MTRPTTVSRRAVVGAALLAAAGIGTAARAAEEKPLSPVGEWLVVSIGGLGALDRAQTTLVIAADGTVSGTGGCNSYHGKAEIAGARLSFGPLAATRMACTPSVMAQEQKFFSTLDRVQAWRIDPLTRHLFLMDLTGTVLVRLAAA